MIRRFWRWLVGTKEIHIRGVYCGPPVHGIAAMAPMQGNVVIAYNDGKIVLLKDDLSTGCPTIITLRTA